MSDERRRQIPTIKDGDRAALDYVKQHFNDQSTYRRSIMMRLAWNLHMKNGFHWLEPDRSLSAGSGTFRFVDVYRQGKKRLPRPVDNLTGEGIKNLVDRITRKQYEPAPRAGSREPEIEAAARLQRDILLYDMEQAKWPSAIDRPLVTDLVTFGTCIGRDLWDETLDSTMPIGAQDARKCAACGNKYASEEWKIGETQQWREGGGDMQRLMDRSEAGQGSYKMGACPMCDTPEDGKLEPYTPEPDEVSSGAPDLFGRPMSQQVPKGEGVWEVPSPFEIYPENGGLIDTQKCRVWGQKTVRPMEWIQARVDPKVMAHIEPEPTHELIKHHPTHGDQLNRAKSRDENIYGNHAMVLDLTVEPIQVGGDAPEDGLRWGRFIRVIGDRVVKNDPLMREVPGTEGEDGKLTRIPVSVYGAGVAEEVRGEFWGKTPADDARPLNQMLNRLLAIDEDEAERGVVMVAIPEGVDWETQDDEAAGSHRMYRYNATAVKDWDPRSALVNPNPGTGNRNAEKIESLRQRIGQILGPVEAESGMAGGAKSALQYQAMSEQAAQKLNQMDAARVGVQEKLLEHRADAIWAFRREGGTYEVKNEAGDFEKKAYQHKELLQQAKVSLDTKGTFDQSLLQSQKAESAFDRGFYGQPGTLDQETTDDLLELMSLPKLNNVQSVQVKNAKAAWVDFQNEQVVPYIDVTIQDTWIYYQVLGKLWQGDEARKILADAGWEGVLRKIAGWEPKLEQAELMDTQARAIYEGIPPEQWQQVHEDYTAKAEAANATGAALGQPPIPAPVPPPQEFLPASLCDRLLMLWRQMLGMVDPEVVDPAQAQMLEMAAVSMDPAQKAAADAYAQAKAIDPVLRMYAVIQECRLDAKRKQTQAAMGASVPAAPGGGSTPTGGVPAPGTPVAPAAGVDQAVRGAA